MIKTATTTYLLLIFTFFSASRYFFLRLDPLFNSQAISPIVVTQ
jgi:hypothetical protein